MNNSHELNSKNSSLTARYISRPRLDNIFEQAIDSKLIYVIAGTGYGKTQAVRHYLEQRKTAVVRWMQLTDSDNIGSRYWESFTHMISVRNTELAAKLRSFGFPETLIDFKQFAEIIKSIEYSSREIFFVLDDFHLIDSHKVLSFVERCVHLRLPGVCFVILSRREPDMNIVSLHSKNKVSIITEDELRFTAEEAAAFFREQSIPFSRQNLLQTLEATKGWPLAINMLSLILKRTPNSLKYALDAMMQNIFKFLEVEAWGDFSESTQKIIVKLALLSNLPVTPLQALMNETTHEGEFLRNVPGLTSFMWFSSFTNELKIHPLYLEFLQSKHHILSHEESQDIYQWAAEWCIKNDFYVDAIDYYAKLGQFENILKVLLAHPFKLPRDTSEHFLNIIEDLAPYSEDEEQSTGFLFLKNYFVPLLLAGAERYEEAKERSLEVIKEWESTDDSRSALFIYSSYSNLAYIDMYTCTFTHQYNAPEYIKKSVEYFNLTSVPPAKVTGAFINADVRSFACLVGEGAGLDKLDEFLEASKQSALFIEQTPYSVYAGYEELVACEYAFYKNRPDIARNHAHNAIMKAREKNQYSIEAMADNYLLRMAALEGDSSLAKAVLKQMRSYLDNTDFWNRQLYYDLYTGAFYSLIGLPDMVPQWLVMDENEMAFEIRIPTRELTISALYYISSKKYQHALTILSNSYPRAPRERFLFGELKLLLLTAIARVKTDDVKGAVADFEKAYKMSFDGVFEMFFIERGKELHPLVVAALKQGACAIPEEWLKMIDRKASIYAKKTAVVAHALKGESGHKEAAALSDREREVLIDLYHGLSREEIAVNRYLSINTVKKILQSIYVKLDANNNVDAVRIALERKLIE